MPVYSKNAAIVEWDIRRKCGRFVYKGKSVYVEIGAFAPKPEEGENLKGRAIEFNPKVIIETKLPENKPKQRSTIRLIIKEVILKPK
jgi:hypothetical protein